MAWKLKFRCSSCGYEADVYEGRGLFRQEITAMACPDCKTIQNIVVGGTRTYTLPRTGKDIVATIWNDNGTTSQKTLKWDGQRFKLVSP